MNNKCAVGGQAVIEGVMMRGKDKIAVAVRKEDESIIAQCDPLNSILTKWPVLKLPIIRGFVSLIESMVLGIQALSFSANQAAGQGEEIKPWEMFLTLLFSLGLAGGLFIIAPALSIDLFHYFTDNIVILNFLEGVVRIVIFLIYVYAISRLPDIQRVFQYHGAEHKVIHVHEAGEELTVENALKYSPVHPRCGTSFLLIVMVISVFAFSFLGKQDIVARIASRFLLVPLIAGVSYEFLKISGKYPNHPLLRVLILPGLWLQQLTTREPDAKQIEVAIVALKKVL